MSLTSPQARAYLERLRDLLPASEAERVVAEVESLIHERVEAMSPGIPAAQAEERALARLGVPEALIDTLAEQPISVGVSARRSFARWWCVLAACHLLLSVALTMAGATRPAVPGLLGPLAMGSVVATLTSALGVLLLDAGLLFAWFALSGGWGRPGRLGAPDLPRGWSRGEAWRTLVLLALLAVILHPLRDRIFAVRSDGRSVPFLANDLIGLLPWLDAVLALVALRCAVVLAGRGASALAHGLDLLAGALGLYLLVRAATASSVVDLPREVLGGPTAEVLNNVLTRVLLTVALAMALFLCVGLVRRALRLKQALGR